MCCTQERLNGDGCEAGDGKYRPPKWMPMPYAGDLEDQALQRSKLSQRAKERASRSRLLQDLAEQLDERPEEVSVQGSGYASTHTRSGNGSSSMHGTEDDHKWAERENFEEEHFLRLSMSKKDKQLQKRLGSGRASLMRFQNEFSVRLRVLYFILLMKEFLHTCVFFGKKNRTWTRISRTFRA
jgi:hypothetical protein